MLCRYILSILKNQYLKLSTGKYFTLNFHNGHMFDQLNHPMDIDSLVSAVTGKKQVVEIYLASLMAIDVDTQVEKPIYRCCDAGAHLNH